MPFDGAGVCVLFLFVVAGPPIGVLPVLIDSVARSEVAPSVFHALLGGIVGSLFLAATAYPVAGLSPAIAALLLVFFARTLPPAFRPLTPGPLAIVGATAGLLGPFLWFTALGFVEPRLMLSDPVLADFCAYGSLSGCVCGALSTQFGARSV